MKTLRFVLAVTCSMLLITTGYSPGAFAQDDIPTIGFGLTFGDYKESENEPDCNEGEHHIFCAVQLEDDGPHYFTQMLSLEDDQPILRMSIEGLGGTSVEDAHMHALHFAPQDAELVDEETWSDGTIYETYSSEWLADAFPDNPGLWAGEEPGTFALVIQQKLGKDEIARSILTLPMASYSEEAFRTLPRPNGRTQCQSRVYMDAGPSAEGRLIALERILYEAMDQNLECVVGLAYAYTEGSDLGEFPNVGKAAVSLDGDGIDGDGLFPMKDDDSEELQAALTKSPDSFEETVYVLAK